MSMFKVNRPHSFTDRSTARLPNCCTNRLCGVYIFEDIIKTEIHTSDKQQGDYNDKV